MMRIDSHQHFWQLARGDYGWLTSDLKPIYRDFLPDDLAPLLQRGGIGGTVVVQAAPTVAETEFMLSLAAQESFIRGVVGWVDFETRSAPQQIAAMAQDPKLVSLRPMIQDIADVDWMLGDALAPAFRALIDCDLTFDALVKPPHLKNLHTLLTRHGDMRVVIDHGAKPQLHDGTLDGWANDMAALARDTDAYCKLSGLVTEAGTGWTVDDLRPIVDHLLDTFGPERLIWGSDWPVCTLAASYGDWLDATDRLLSALSQSDLDAIMGGNAVHIYKLEE
ncbi:amidohydrolase [Hoeflea sp. TYP-13]|uniref:amidohydrolase n=1 Tax=Hoeflea sp. TYP-13 TaxID=3230023 RepID=UPI0034C6CA63